MFGKEKLVFDPAAAGETDNVGAYLRASDGTLLTHTDVDGKKALDVNVANTVEVTAENLDIRDLNAATDSVAINGIEAGGNALVINPDGSINVQAEIDVVNGSDKVEDSAHASGDTGTYVLAVRQDTLASSVSADGDYASFKVSEKGALWVKHDGAIDTSPGAYSGWLSSQNTVDTTAELVVAADLTDRKKILIQNASTGGRTIYLGHSNAVSSSNGIRLSAGAAIELELAAGVAIWAISSAAGADVRIAEFASA